MSRVLAASVLAILTAGALVACGGSSVDASCAVDDLTHEFEHIVEESLFEVQSVDELRCSGDWAVVTATVGGEGAEEPFSDTMVFRKANDMWVLKSPELVCDPNAGDEAITGDLADTVCSNG